MFSISIVGLKKGSKLYKSGLLAINSHVVKGKTFRRDFAS